MPDFTGGSTLDPLAADAELGQVQSSKTEARRVTAEGSQVTPYVSDFVGSNLRAGNDRVLSAQEANEQFGVEGRLSFTRPVRQSEADYKSRRAVSAQWRDEVLSQTELSGADAIWQSLKGAALDPVAIPTYFIGLGEVKTAGTAGAVAFGRNRLILSGMARGAGENVLGGLVLEGANYGLKRAADEDYDFGQAFDNLTIGAVLGGGLGAVGGNMRFSRAQKAGGVAGVIAQAADKYGVSADTLTRIAEIESRLKPDAKNPNSSAGGLFQFLDKTWEGLGGGNKFDAVLSSERAALQTRANAAGLRAALGREPEPWELYLAHQQGLAGARRLLFDPTLRAADLVGAKEVKLNGGRLDMSAGEFAGLWRDKFNGGAREAVSAPIERPLPEPLRMLSPAERGGMFEQAMEQFLDDTRIDVSELIPTDARPLSRRAEDGGAFMAIPSRLFQDDIAITNRSTEVPVRYAVVEAEDLITSQTDDMVDNPAYPSDYQPRDRGRLGSVAHNKELENIAHPALLMSERSAAGGAPIVTREGVVLSGNGRAIMTRRSARTGTAFYERYRAQLKAENYDTEGMKNPVLIRVVAADLSQGELIRMGMEMNGSGVERMSVTEQARVDAQRLPPEAIGLLRSADVGAAANRDFVKAFTRYAAPDDVNALNTAEGQLSAEGVRRMRAALVYKAYENGWLIERMFEDADPNIKAIGQALVNAAPGWAKLKALAALDRIAPETDFSYDLGEVVRMIEAGRNDGRPLKTVLEERIAQTDFMSGDAVSAVQVGLLRVLFKDTDFRVPRSIDDITRAMDTYTAAALEIQPGVDLLGNRAIDEVRTTFQASVRALDDNFTLESDRVFTLRTDSDRSAARIASALADGQNAGGAGRSGSEARGGGAQDGAGGGGPAAGADGASPNGRIDAAALIAADPELKQIAADIAFFDPGGTIVPEGLENPDTIAEAMRALGQCLLGGE